MTSNREFSPPQASDCALPVKEQGIAHNDQETGGTRPVAPTEVALLTGGDDKPYALGLASALISQGIAFDFIGSDAVDGPELHKNRLVNFLNLRGSQREDASVGRKVARILTYYGRLLRYAASAKPKIFHILWNNKFEFFDRVALMLYYRCLGKKVVLTAHNVNAAKRDLRDGFLNRFSLRAQYGLSSHIFVHTEKMKAELLAEFDVPASKVSVIPFGINNTLPTTDLTTREARRRLGLGDGEKTVLFFGQIAPYKGLEYLVEAFAEFVKTEKGSRLVIAGKVKSGHADYWSEIERKIDVGGIRDRTSIRIQHIPDSEVELYFKAADVIVIPYVDIFQSGVPFLAYSFGLPVIVSDVGSLREDVVEGSTGFVFSPRDSMALANAMKMYFDSDLYRNLDLRRPEIRNYAGKRYSWTQVGKITHGVYLQLMDR